MKFHLSSIAFAVLLFMTACNNNSNSNPNPTAADNSQPPIETTAVKLLADYEADEPAAEKVYGGRTLIVSGEIMSIDKKSDGTLEILLNSQESSMGSVRCHFSAEKAAALANVNRKDSITVKGICMNMDSHVQVVIKDCELSSKANANLIAPAMNASPNNEPHNTNVL